MFQYFKISTFHSAFEMIPQHYNLDEAVKSFNSNFNITLPLVDIHDAERVYVAAIPQNYYGVVINKNIPAISYTVYFAWTNGDIRMEIQFLQDHKHLKLSKKTIWLNGQIVSNPDDYLEYTFQD